MMSLVWELLLPDSEKLVLLALADCANDEGVCWPSMATLAKKCSKSDRTVQACIKALCAKHHLTRDEIAGKGCKYTVHPIVRFAADPRSDITPEAPAPPKGATLTPEEISPTPEAASDKPSKNHKKPSYLKGVGLPEGFPAEPYMALVRARKAIPKVPFTEDAARGIVRKCLKLQDDGYDIAKLLWKAVDHGWRTVFPADDCKAIAPTKGKEWTVDELRNAIRFRRDSGDEAKAKEYEAELERKLAA